MYQPMIIPTILAGLLLGALYHLLWGGGAAQLALRLLFGVAGFWVAQLAGLGIWMLGGLDVGSGLLGAMLTLLAGDWLTQIKPAG